jgi:hypothetical protein
MVQSGKLLPTFPAIFANAGYTGTKKVPPYCFGEYAEILDRVYEALGRTDDLRELRKRHFLRLPPSTTATVLDQTYPW